MNIDNGAIKDIGGNSFSGISDNSSWNYTTAAGSGSDLVFHLPFDTDMSDISGNRFDAKLGVAATADVEFVSDATRGQVIKFNAGSYATLPKHDLLRPSGTQDFSVNFWIKAPAIGSDPAIVGNKDWNSGGNPGWLIALDGALEYDPSDAANDKRGWLINLAAEESKISAPQIAGGRMDWKAGNTTPKAPALADDEWHMVTLVFDQVSKVLVVYIDGTSYSESSNAASFDLNILNGTQMYDVAKDYPFTIWESLAGDDPRGNYNARSDTRKTLSGLMDELSYYNKALTSSEITTLLSN